MGRNVGDLGAISNDFPFRRPSSPLPVAVNCCGPKARPSSAHAEKLKSSVDTGLRDVGLLAQAEGDGFGKDSNAR